MYDVTKPVKNILGPHPKKDIYVKNKETWTVDDIWLHWNDHNLLEDRSEYSVDDIMSAYPGVTLPQAKELRARLDKWKYSKNLGVQKSYRI